MTTVSGKRIYAYHESVNIKALEINHKTWTNASVEHRTPLLNRNAARFTALSALENQLRNDLPALTLYLSNTGFKNARFSTEAENTLKSREETVVNDLNTLQKRNIPISGALNMVLGKLGLMSYVEHDLKTHKQNIYIVKEGFPDIFDKNDLTVTMTPYAVKNLSTDAYSMQLPPEVLAFSRLLQMERAGLIANQYPATKILGFDLFESEENARQYWVDGLVQSEKGFKISMQFMIKLSVEYLKLIRDGNVEDELADVSLMVAQAVRALKWEAACSTEKPAEEKPVAASPAAPAPNSNMVLPKTGMPTNTVKILLSDESLSLAARGKLNEMLIKQQELPLASFDAWLANEFKIMTEDQRIDAFSAFFTLFSKFSPTTTCELGGHNIRFRNLLTIKKVLSKIERESNNKPVPDAASVQVKSGSNPVPESPKKAVAGTETNGPKETQKTLDAPERPKKQSRVKERTFDVLFPKGSISEEYISHLKWLVGKYDEMKETAFKNKLTVEELFGKIGMEKEKALKFCQSVKARLVNNASDINWADENDIGCKVHTIITFITSKLK